MGEARLLIGVPKTFVIWRVSISYYMQFLQLIPVVLTRFIYENNVQSTQFRTHYGNSRPDKMKVFLPLFDIISFKLHFDGTY